MSVMRTDDKMSFTAIYDQYAASLLGIITKILHNEVESVQVLEATFVKARLHILEFQPQSQSLFVWLLKIARNTAMDTLEKRSRILNKDFRLTVAEQVFSSFSKKYSLIEVISPVSDNIQKRLLDTILFKSCTPEEAATSLSLPIGIARQQLRLAMQQLRTSQKFE